MRLLEKATKGRLPSKKEYSVQKGDEFLNLQSYPAKEIEGNCKRSEWYNKFPGKRGLLGERKKGGKRTEKKHSKTFLYFNPKPHRIGHCE